ncbi:MAG: type II toxin-antitoxin system VapC family toxin [Deltaproteobacteria bacterium]|nr:type II toxin-antitoxin system VapC family toxin [Deltaproteobacteria bacterium]
MQEKVYERQNPCLAILGHLGYGRELLTVTIYEVFKVVLRESNENEALQAAAAMRKGRVVDLTASMAISASRISLEHKIPMADSIILATAKEFKAVIWTQDSDFKNMADVKYFSKK